MHKAQKASRVGKSLRKQNTPSGLPSAFELAILATLNGGNFKEAFGTYLLASEYLDTEVEKELELRRKAQGTIAERGEAFRERVRSGELKGKAIQKAYEELVTLVRPFLSDAELFIDGRDDSVKTSIRELTGRRCNADTARDYLRAAWMRSRLPKRVAIDSENMPTDEKRRAVEIKEWNKWCDKHRNRSSKSFVFPQALLDAALQWIKDRRTPRAGA
jgi:hypothetical protein